VIGDPPVLFGDQSHLSWPEAGLVGVETVGGAGTVHHADNGTPNTGWEGKLLPFAFTATTVTE
jgi:hypothetical protein